MPEQVVLPLTYCGVTVIIAVTGEVPMFTAVNEGMLVEPLPANPIDVLLLVHV